MWTPAFDSTCTVIPLRSMSASRPLPISVILSAAFATTSGTLPAAGDGAEGFWLPGISRLKCSSSVTVRIFSPGAVSVSHGRLTSEYSDIVELNRALQNRSFQETDRDPRHRRDDDCSNHQRQHVAPDRPHTIGRLDAADGTGGIVADAERRRE